MSVKYINNVKSLKEYFSTIINESLEASLHKQAIAEEEIQDDMSAEEESDEDVLKKGDVKVDDVIEKLNTIRSGRSLKDKKIAAAMNNYINSLERAEQVALLAFLKGIAQIVTAETPESEVIDPAEFPASIQMKKKSSEKTVVIKSTIVKKQEDDDDKQKAGEDISGPAPIKPKK